MRLQISWILLNSFVFLLKRQAISKDYGLFRVKSTILYLFNLIGLHPAYYPPPATKLKASITCSSYLLQVRLQPKQHPD